MEKKNAAPLLLPLSGYQKFPSQILHILHAFKASITSEFQRPSWKPACITWWFNRHNGKPLLPPKKVRVIHFSPLGDVFMRWGPLQAPLGILPARKMITILQHFHMQNWWQTPWKDKSRGVSRVCWPQERVPVTTVQKTFW